MHGIVFTNVFLYVLEYVHINVRIYGVQFSMMYVCIMNVMNIQGDMWLQGSCENC